MKTILLRLTPNQHKAIKLHCVKNDISMNEFLLRAAVSKMSEEKVKVGAV